MSFTRPHISQVFYAYEGKADTPHVLSCAPVDVGTGEPHRQGFGDIYQAADERAVYTDMRQKQDGALRRSGLS